MNNNLLSFSDLLQLVSSCDDLPGSPIVIVARVIGDDGAASDEVVVLIEKEAGPRKFSRAGLTVTQS